MAAVASGAPAGHRGQLGTRELGCPARCPHRRGATAAATAVRRQVREITLSGCRLLPRADGGLADRAAVATVAVLRAGLALRLTADEATPAAAGVLQAVSSRGATFVRARARLLQARTGRRGSRRGAGLAAFARLVGVFAGAL